MSIKKTLIVLSISSVVLFPTAFVFAAADQPITYDYAPPCVGDSCQSLTNPETLIQDYLIRLYQFAIGISGIAAVGMIVWGSVLVATSESITKKQDGREYISSAVIGILLLFGSYLLLKTINPNIVNLTAIEAPKLKDTATSTDQASLSCGDPKRIPYADEVVAVLGSGGKLLPDDAMSGCKYRRLAVKEAQPIGYAPNGSFYDGLTPWGVAGKQIWGTDTLYFFPYYKTKDGPSSARCVLYGIRDTKISGTLQYTEAKLSKDTKPCLVNPDQDPGQEGSAGAGGPGAAGACDPVIDPSTGAPGPDQCPIPASAKAAAAALRTASNVTFSGSASCAPSDTSASGAIGLMASGKTPYVCYNGCSATSNPCTRNANTYVSESLLGALKQVANANGGIPVVIQSFTGGSHAGGSSHYQGRAVDITTNSTQNYKTLINGLNAAGVSAKCEWADGSMHADCDSAPSIAPGSGTHIHAQM